MRQRGLVHGLAWTLATGAAVTLSWWGVHTVMAGTAYDRPRALPVTSTPDATEDANPQASSTHRPRETPKPKTSDESGGKEPDKGRVGAAGGDSSGGTPAKRSPSNGGSSGSGTSGNSGSGSGTRPSGSVKSYTVAGGRVAFEMDASSAELVSATPDSGWQMQVWKQQEWIRVTFTQGSREVSVFCTWHDHAPMVEIDDR